MNSKTTDRFWKCHLKLPIEIKKLSKNAYKLFLTNPYHPSLHFKSVHSTRPVFSIRITKDYRALGLLNNNDIIWFWIGSHSDYDNLVRQLRNK